MDFQSNDGVLDKQVCMQCGQDGNTNKRCTYIKVQIGTKYAQNLGTQYAFLTIIDLFEVQGAQDETEH